VRRNRGNPVKYKAVIFDWDGVITDSVNIKTEAFAEMFRPFGVEVEEKVIAYHLAHGGISRFEKFGYFYSSILNQPLDDAKLNELCLRFSKLVKDKVIAAPFVNGAVETIKSAKEAGALLFIVSGTPTDEIIAIAAAKDLAKYFIEILGSPANKPDLIKRLLIKYRLKPSEAIFFGDAIEDYGAAAKTGVKFIGVKIRGCHTKFPPETKVIEEVLL
jgi:phosphoglycolate phosphatase-like HAD superfamily hydrolase